jgi:hypothetical protein
MPKRVIDGEGLWHSDKLALVEPPSFRAEYACLLPLALANGVFEANASHLGKGLQLQPARRQRRGSGEDTRRI